MTTGSGCSWGGDEFGTPIVISQIGRLTRVVPLAGPAAHAIAVYAEPLSADAGLPEYLRPADERGFEGVACVDDAARAVVLYCALWRRWGLPSAWTAAHGLLRFLAYMQEEDGRFANFILDWAGQRNLTGSTSFLGGPQWQARALHALACGAATFGGTEWDERFRRGLRWVDDFIPYMDVRAVCVLAAVQHWQATGTASSAERAVAWAQEIAGYGSGDCLLNEAAVEPIHLWGHLQETALAETGRAFRRPDLVERGRVSAESLLLPAVDECLISEHVLPFDVSCVVSGLSAVARATGNVRYAAAAARARSWFFGRNAAGQPVYDRGRGLVYDGIDEGRVSRNSGAESNIEGALALLCWRRSSADKMTSQNVWKKGLSSHRW